MALIDGELGTAIFRANKMVGDAFMEHEKHVTNILLQNLLLLEDSVRLYEENAKLREQASVEHAQLDDMKSAADMTVDDYSVLVNENKELRELVTDMWHDLQVYGYKVECMLNARYINRMRKLGIEEG